VTTVPFEPAAAAQRERVGLLLVNVGTPAAPRPREVRRYLREFLSDPRVLDLPAWRRRLLLELVILPRRARASAAAYRQIWTDQGSPLLVHGRALAAKLQARLGDGVRVELAMRYGSPSIAGALDRLERAGATRLVLRPPGRPSRASWSSRHGAGPRRCCRSCRRSTTIPPTSTSGPSWRARFSSVPNPITSS
jgi:ferrochelatase